MPRYVYSRTLADDLAHSARTDVPTCSGWARVEGSLVFPLSASPFEPHAAHCADPIALDELHLDAPALPGVKLVCAARNYRKHAAELNNPVPSEPLVFMKPASALSGHGHPIQLPVDQSELIHHEGELAVVIGKRAQRIAAAEVDEHVFGYTIMNDVTARDLQRRDGCFTRAKGFDTFAPLGPWIDTDYRVRDQRLQLWVNKDLRQDGRLDEMLFDVPTLISWVSKVMTLEPGDIIATGTPAGVGVLLPGDTVRIEIEGLGALSNPVRARG